MLVARIVAEIAVIIPTPVTPACLSNMFCLKIFYFQPLSLLEFHHGAVPIICAFYALADIGDMEDPGKVKFNSNFKVKILNYRLPSFCGHLCHYFW